jgi:serine/threonine protein kinase
MEDSLSIFYIFYIPDKTITLSDFEIIEELGKGAYGEVVYAKHKKSGNEVAIKICNKKFLQKEQK